MSVPAAPSGTTSRWRAFADAVALALGLNLWVSMVLVPGFIAGALDTGLAKLVAMVPIVTLIYGVIRRSDAMLLLGYPVTLLVPLATAPNLADVHTYGPARFVLVAVGLIAYLLCASLFTSFREVPEPRSRRPLASSEQPMPIRWRRRLRVYQAIVGLSIIFPVVFLYTVNFDPVTRELLTLRYHGRIAAFTTVLNVVVMAVWALLYVWFFLGIMRPHRTGDRDLQADLARLAKRGHSRKPGLTFYAGIAVAVVLLAVLAVTR